MENITKEQFIVMTAHLTNKQRVEAQEVLLSAGFRWFGTESTDIRDIEGSDLLCEPKGWRMHKVMTNGYPSVTKINLACLLKATKGKLRQHLLNGMDIVLADGRELMYHNGYFLFNNGVSVAMWDVEKEYTETLHSVNHPHLDVVKIIDRCGTVIMDRVERLRIAGFEFTVKTLNDLVNMGKVTLTREELAAMASVVLKVGAEQNAEQNTEQEAKHEVLAGGWYLLEDNPSTL